MAQPLVTDDLWAIVEPLLPKSRHPRRSDPEAGGSYDPQGRPLSSAATPGGGEVYSALNDDGSGRLSDEIAYEANQQGYYPGLNLGLVGWSWGGGMIWNIASNLRDLTIDKGAVHVTFAATIDATIYASNWQALEVSPAAVSGGSGFNYFQSNPNPQIIQGYPNMGGAQSNKPYFGVNHSKIGINFDMLTDVEHDLYSIYDALSH